MVTWLDGIIAAVGPLAYVALALSAMLEYVFPPFPGDTIAVLGGVYAVRGEKPMAAVLFAITLGSLVGATVDYAAGRWLARHMERHPERRRFFGFERTKLEAVQARVRRHGSWLIVVNRFLPAVRSLFFVAAGAARMPLGRVLVLGALSSVAWNALLMGVGVLLGGNAERLEQLVRRYQVAVWALLGLALLGAVVRVLATRKRPRSA